MATKRYAYPPTIVNNRGKKDKVKVELDRDLLNELIKLKQVGDTYSDAIRRLLEGCG
ncbi:MAG TPA: hypothetical protein HA348_00890 [Thermoplasmata archaeon]|nr:hypothetical protein [Thermoplasmata archaeon]